MCLFCILMMPAIHLPYVDSCCGCIGDLKLAVAIIAVMGIVTSPAVSWAVIRHSYVIRVSCIVTTNASRPDVVDVNLNNVLTFGFGSNSGLGPSCLSPEKADSSAPLILIVRYIGWLALVCDVIFLITSIYLLLHLTMGDDRVATKRFMIAVALSMFISFLYALLYVSACASIGGSFPVFEFIFAFVDFGIWAYFLIVVRSYRKLGESHDSSTPLPPRNK